MPSPQGVNVGGDLGFKSENDHYAVLDALPRKLRVMLKDAPYQFAIGELNDYYQRLRGAGMTEDEAATEAEGKFRQMMERMLRAEVNKLYGPEHPQAEGKRP